VATKAQIEKAILEREGFRVELQLFDGKRPSLLAYDYPVMAPQRWKVSDWKNARLEAYRLLVKGVTILPWRQRTDQAGRAAWQSARYLLRGCLRFIGAAAGG
jgi:hypothetical protein